MQIFAVGSSQEGNRTAAVAVNASLSALHCSIPLTDPRYRPSAGRAKTHYRAVDIWLQEAYQLWQEVAIYGPWDQHEFCLVTKLLCAGWGGQGQGNQWRFTDKLVKFNKADYFVSLIQSESSIFSDWLGGM